MSSAPVRQAADPQNAWVVRLTRRRDGKKYYFRWDGATTARKESSMRLDEATAKQLAQAIRTHHRDFSAWALKYDSRRHDSPGASKRPTARHDGVETTVPGRYVT